MAALGSQSIASSYEQLLHVDRDGGGNTTTHVSIKDGDNGTTFGFTIASDALMMTSTNRLEFGDTGTYIHQSADGVLDLVSDTEIEINATTIDMNGALDLSGNAQLSGTVTVGADGSGTDVIFYSGTAGDNFSWDASEEKLTITGTNGQTALDVADGNLVVADNVDIEGDIDVNGTANLDNTDIEGTLAVDGTTISLDATTSFNIDNSNTSNGITIGTATSGVPISIGHTTSETTVNDNLVVTGDIDLEGSIDVNGTANLDAVDIDGAVQIDNTVTVGADDQGYDVIFYGDTASSNMTWDTSGDDLILNDSSLLIDQDDNAAAFKIDSEGTTTNVFTIEADALTTGAGAYVYSNSSSTGTRNLVEIQNDNELATGTTALKIKQDANQKAIVIDSAATSNHVMRIDGPLTTTGTCLLIDDVDAITTGSIASFLSNSVDNSTRNLVQITNDNPSADNAVLLYLDQDGADYVIEDSSGAKLTAAGVWTDASDVLRKKDVVDLPYGLSELLQMQPKKYVYKHKDISGIGFIAQEMEKIIPEIVTGEDARLEDVVKKEAVEAVEEVLYVEGDELPEGIKVGDVKIEAVEATEAVIEYDTIVGGKSIAYGELTSILVKAIQELSAKVTALEG